MKIDDIVSAWDKDSEIDQTELATESANIPKVHNKYIKIFMQERVALLKLRNVQKKIKRTLSEYYLGELDKDELATLGRDQFYKKVLKQDLELHIESDDLMVDSSVKVGLQQEKVKFVESIIKQIENRNWQIRNAIEWNKFVSG